MTNHMIKMLTKSFPYEPKISELDEEGEQVEQFDLTEYAMRDPLLFGDYRNAVAGELNRNYHLPFIISTSTHYSPPQLFRVPSCISPSSSPHSIPPAFLIIPFYSSSVTTDEALHLRSKPSWRFYYPIR